LYPVTNCKYLYNPHHSCTYYVNIYAIQLQLQSSLIKKHLSIYNDPTTTPQRPTTTPRRPTTTPQRPTTIQNQPQRHTTSHNDSQRPTSSQQSNNNNIQSVPRSLATISTSTAIPVIEKIRA
jgi:hypothetical protein